MRIRTLKELHEKNLLTDDQFARLELLTFRKIVSVFYELRIALYLGVLLFTSGMGILVYKNIGDIGHLLSIIALFALTVVCFVYTHRYAPDYSNARVKPPTPFFDYIVLLGCLLFISLLTYLQFQYNILDDTMGMTTAITSLFFFYSAYRFDHAGVLSLAITALGSFFSISLSPQKWYSGDFFETADLHIKAIVVGAVLSVIAIALDRKSIKQHFTFTYINFSSLMFLTGALAGVFMNSDSYGLYLLILFAGCGAAVYFANLKKSFLFLLYAFVFGYIGLTYFLGDIILYEAGLWFIYLVASCGGFVFFIIRYKNFFKRAE